jgi:hypothetical protein
LNYAATKARHSSGKNEDSDFRIKSSNIKPNIKGICEKEKEKPLLIYKL